MTAADAPGTNCTARASGRSRGYRTDGGRREFVSSRSQMGLTVPWLAVRFGVMCGRSARAKIEPVRCPCYRSRPGSHRSTVAIRRRGPATSSWLHLVQQREQFAVRPQS